MLQGFISTLVLHTLRNRTRRPEAVNIGTYRKEASDRAWRAVLRLEKVLKQHSHMISYSIFYQNDLAWEDIFHKTLEGNA